MASQGFTKNIEINSDVDKVLQEEEKNSDKTNKKAINDYLDSVFKKLTETEKNILDVLYKSKSAITSDKIRNYFIYGYINSIIINWRSSMRSDKFIRRVSNEGVALERMCINFLNGHYDNPVANSVKQPSLNIDFGNAENILEKLFLVHLPEDDKNSLKSSRIAKDKKVQEIMNDSYSRLSDETEYEFLNRANDIISGYKQGVPSKNKINSVLRYFKRMDWVNYRKDNKKRVWFLTSKMNLLMRRFGRMREDKEPQKYPIKTMLDRTDKKFLNKNNSKNSNSKKEKSSNKKEKNSSENKDGDFLKNKLNKNMDNFGNRNFTGSLK